MSDRDTIGRGPTIAAVDVPETSGWSRHKTLILAAICVAQFMVVLDIAVVNVALPSIRTDLHFTEESLQWVVTAYTILFGGFLLLGGRLSDIIGRRRVFMGGLALFSVSSLLCGFAWSEASLITFRAVQGLGGAMLSPAALSILVTTFAEGRERNLALGVWGGIAGSGAAAGTLLGGVLTTGLGWQWIFFVNVPIGAALVAFSPLLLPAEHGSLTRRGFDVPGAVTATAGLMILVYALTRATQIGWSAGETIVLLIVAVALLAAFLGIELRSRVALLPLRVLRLPMPRAANIVGFLIGAAVFSQFFLLSLYMQQVLHYSALKTGVAYVASTLTSIVFAVVAQALVTRVGVRVILPIGMFLLAVAVGLFTRLPVNGSYTTDLLPGFLLAGIGLGLGFVPVAIASVTGVEPQEAGAASGLINTSQQIGGAVGLAAVITIATTATTSFAKAHVALGAAVGPASLTHGFRVAFVVLVGVSVIAAVLAATLGRRSPAVEGAGAGQLLPAGGSPATGMVAGRSRPVRVLGLVSHQDGSPATELWRAARETAPPGMTIDEFDVAALPAFAARPMGAEADAAVGQLWTAAQRAEAVLVAAPGQASAATSAVANAIAWAADHPIVSPLTGKPVALMGGSGTAPGTANAAAQLRAAFVSRGAHVLSDPQAAIVEQGRGGPPASLSDESRESVASLLDTLLELATAYERAA